MSVESLRSNLKRVEEEDIVPSRSLCMLQNVMPVLFLSLQELQVIILPVKRGRGWWGEGGGAGGGG